MKELIRRLFLRPMIATELIIASAFISVLALASPLFVMQVLNRYVSQGVDATLVTLVMGVLIAIGLEFAMRQARLRLARGVNVIPDEAAAFAGFGVLSRARMSSLEKVPPEARREIVNGVSTLETAYNANNIATVLDVPFSLIFIFVLYLIEPTIAYIATGFLVAIFLGGVWSGISLRKKTAELQEVSAQGSALLGTVTREGDTVRAFNADHFLRQAWQKHVRFSQRKRRDLTSDQGILQTFTLTANGLLSVAVIAVGATLVVMGKMDTGAMIGCNILAARALQPISKFSQLGAGFAKAREALQIFKKMSAVALEADGGSAMAEYKGGLEFRDAAFAIGGGTTPLFESLSLKLEPGSVLVVTGANGTGKTTVARLIAGLLEPTRGQIFADGLDLQQIAPEWWRRQIIYLPQEPSLLNATIEENLRINAPDMEAAELNQIVKAAGLRRFLDESPNGFETQIIDNGWRLSEGIRRRIALARALATRGMLAVIDEPTESLDAEGSAAVHAVLGQLVKRGCTVIVMSHDKNIVKGRHIVLDLDAKPVPLIRHVTPDVQPVAQQTTPAGTAP